MADIPNNEATSSPGFLEDVSHFFRVLRRGRGLMVLTVTFCLALAGLYLWLSPPMYEATTSLLVLRQGKSIPVVTRSVDINQALEGGGLLHEDFVPTQMAIIRSPEVVKRAIDAVGLDNLPTLKEKLKEGQDPAHVALEKLLKVSRSDRMAQVIQVTYRVRSEEEGIRMLEALMTSYRQFLAERYEREGHVIAVIEKARKDLNGELAESERKYAEFRQTHPLVSTDKDGRSLLMIRLARWDQARAELRVREAQLRGQLTLVKKLSRDGAGLWAIAHIMAVMTGDQGKENGLLAYSSNIAQMTSWDYVKQLSLEQQHLAEKYGPQYSKVQEIQEQIARIQERVRKSRSELERADIGDLVKALEEGLKIGEAIREDVDRGFAADKKLESYFIEEGRLRNEVERRTLLFNTAVTQLRQAEIARDFESINTQPIEKPNVPDLRLGRRYLLKVMLAALFGTVAGTALVLIREKLRPRLYTEADVGQKLDLPVVGRFPVLRGRATVRAGLANLSPGREQLGATLRTNLEILRRSHAGLKVVMVCAPCRGAGATTTAVNLAASLARAGRRTLLVDADLRHSSLARLCGLAAGRDLARLLREEQPTAVAVQHCPIENLDAIVAGQGTISSTELLLSPRLKDVLSEVRPQYDLVVVDAPPVLEAPDACLLATMADGVLLVVRESVTESGASERAVKILRGLGALVMGAILNGSRGRDASEVIQVASLLNGVKKQTSGKMQEERKKMAGVGLE